MSVSTNDPVAPAGAPLELLFEPAGLPRFDLSPEVAGAYGGSIGFRRPSLVANFVASVDGVVAVPAETDSGPIISRGSAADRFVMALLRACADDVLVGAETLRKATGEPLDAASIYPEAAHALADLRRRLRLTNRPRLVVVTASGRLDPCAALEGAVVFTTPRGEPELRARSLPASTRIVALEGERLRLADVIGRLHADGPRLVLTEGGPSLFAQLVSEGLVDELFLSTSPALFGRFAGDGRKGFTDGRDLDARPLRLLGLRRHGSMSFARWSLR